MEGIDAHATSLIRKSAIGFNGKVMDGSAFTTRQRRLEFGQELVLGT
jgi:hypothetical protein